MITKLKRVILNPYVFSVITKVSIVLLGFAYTVCQSRYLGPSLKGDVAYISSITSISSIVFGCGIHQAYPYFKKRRSGSVLSIFAKLSLYFLFLYFALALAITIIVRADITLSAILMMTPCLVYNRIIAYLNMVESPNKKHATEVIADVLALLLVCCLWMLTPASLGWGIFLLVFKDIVLGVIYSFRIRAAFFDTTERLSLNDALEIVRFGIFPMLALLMTTLNYRVDIIMLKQYVSSADVGVYSVGVMLAERVWMIPDALKEVMISNLAKGKGTEEVSFVIRICNTACIFVVLGIIILGKPFINLFFGSEYSGAYKITVIILVGVVFMVYYKMIGAFNIVEGKQRENFIYLVVSVICNVIINALLIPRVGNIGAAVASIFSYAVSAYLFIHRFVRDNPVRISDMMLVYYKDIRRIRSMINSK